ncbi:MAG TPA: transposase [Herpetosiphonaceae bacterium]
MATPDLPLPAIVAACPVAQKYHALIGPLDWGHFPERSTDRPWPGPRPQLRAPFVAAYLVKLHEQRRSMGDLRRFLSEHPALVWLLGFPLVPDPAAPHGFDVVRSVPSRRQFNRVLRELAPAALQFLLDSTVTAIRAGLPTEVATIFGQVIAGDTKHILAWVKENNPKAYVGEGRYDKTRQPTGDPDCTLGVKQRRTRSPEPDAPPTPTTEPQPAAQRVADDAVYWGYASGVVATKLPGWGEVVLAERTRPFNESDISYFLPLMTQTERRLGFAPAYGAWDTAFDAFYVHDYFHDAGGFAAVPLNPGKRGHQRTFDADGRPCCAAGLGMPVLLRYWDRTSTLVPHERAKHGCPLLYPTPTGTLCPIGDPHFPNGGCTTTVATSVGARLRLHLDRDSATYRAIFQQRTAVERINSQAEALGIERPKLRNQRSIANQNTLIYVLMNLRLLRRIQALHERTEEDVPVMGDAGRTLVA